MSELIALFALALLVTTIVMPWINHARLRTRQREIDDIRKELSKLQKELNKKQSTDATSLHQCFEATKPPTPPAKTGTENSTTAAAPAATLPPPLPHQAKVPSAPPIPASVNKTKEAPGEPVDWFARIAVWVGGIALLMAGFYMVKYSIDTGLLTPSVRLWLTTGFGLALIIAGLITNARSRLQVSVRIGQALSGAGIACLYFASYAAVHLYDFIPHFGGFSAMVVVTLLAVVLSLKQGPPIALMGLIGGFITPWLMSDHSGNTPALFSYLFVIYAAAQFLCLRKGWLLLMFVSIAGAYLWTAAVMIAFVLGDLPQTDGALPFLMAVCATSAFWIRTSSHRSSTLLTWLRPLTWGIGLLQSLLIVAIGEFTALDMSLFAVLGIGALVLALRREEQFGWAAWMAYTFILLSTLVNPEQIAAAYYGWSVGLATLFATVAHWRALRQDATTGWRLLSLFSLLSAGPVIWINRELIHNLPPAADWAWLASAGIAATLIILAAAHLRRHSTLSKKQEGHYNVAAFLLIGFGLWDFVLMIHLSQSIAGLLIGAVFYWRIRRLPEAEWIFGALAGAWIITMLAAIEHTLPYLVGIETHRDYSPNAIELRSWLIGTAAITGACFNKYLNEFSRIALAWVAGGAALLTMTCAYVFFMDHTEASHPELESLRGGLTALLAASSVIAGTLALKRAWTHAATYLLAGLAGSRILTLHLFGNGADGSTFFINALALQFGLPCIAAWLLALIFSKTENEGPRRFFQSSGMLLGFIWASFLVRDYFGWRELIGETSGSTELYAYSVVWLLLAIGYQAAGLLRRAPAIHIGSLFLLLLTAGKVFLVDAAELQGLYRVLSFLGLGLALLGIGYFYNKVVFLSDSKTSKPQTPPAPQQ